MASAKTALGKESDLPVCLIVKREELQKCREVPGMIHFNNLRPPPKKGKKEKKPHPNKPQRKRKLISQKKGEKVECVNYTDVKMVNTVTDSLSV